MGTYGPQLKEAKAMTEILYRTSALSALLCYRQNYLYHLQKSKEHIKAKVERKLSQYRDRAGKEESIGTANALSWQFILCFV